MLKAPAIPFAFIGLSWPFLDLLLHVVVVLVPIASNCPLSQQCQESIVKRKGVATPKVGESPTSSLSYHFLCIAHRKAMVP